MTKEKRFVSLYPDGKFGDYKIIVDSITGVNYMSCIGTGSITPLLDAYGNVMVSSLPINKTDLK